MVLFIMLCFEDIRIWIRNISIFRQKLPIRAAHHTFLECRNSEVTKNRVYYTTHPALPSSIHLHPALCNTFNVTRTKKIARNSAISPNLDRKFQICPFWLKIGTHAWYFRVADFKSGLRFLKFRPQNPFLGKFRPKKKEVGCFAW